MKSAPVLAKSADVIRSASEAEERLHVAMQLGRMYAFEWNPESDSVLRAGDPELIGQLWGTSQDTGEHFLSRVHPEDRERFHQIACELTCERPNYQISYRFIHDNGSVIWLLERGQGFYDSRGTLTRVVGLTADITKTKDAEESLRQMSGRLLTTQEEERQRIARELHDDIGQDIAVLIVRGQKAMSMCDDQEVLEQMQQLHASAQQISRKISRLSHQLHASEIDYIGLPTALEMLCRDLSQTAPFALTCNCKDVPTPGDRNVSIALYRVAQEALHNIVKHANASHVSVEVSGGEDDILLRVKDDGCGFQPEAVKPSGLGLISMRERMNLIGGTLSISSTHARGTIILAQAKLR
jgi:signal transduction histidine kinase